MDGEAQSTTSPTAAALPKQLQEAPDHLSATAKDFFRHVTTGTEFDAPARALLIRFCEVRDELDAVRVELASAMVPKKEGEAASRFVFVDKHNQPRIHPLVKHELALTNECGKLFRLLGWDQAPPDDGGQRKFTF